MKIALFFVALIAGSLAQSNSNNNNCLLGSGAPGSTCATNNQCAYGLSCVNGLCNFVNLGQTCSADTQCGGLYPFCIGGRCDAKRIPGDPCSMNEQCISNMCSGTCMARQLNQACGGSDCAPGLFCSPLTRVCTAKIAVGASCSNEYLAMVSNISFAHDLSVMCADSALCDYNPNSNTNTGICTPIFSATQGSCGAFGSLTCPVGSTCNQNTCSSGSSNNQCVSNAQCGITTFCACSGNSGNNNFQVFTSSSNVHAGVSRQLAGANVGSQGASANVAGAGANVGTQGVAVGTSQTGAAVGTQGVAVGSGQTGAAVGTQGVAVGTGQTGAAVGTQGATVQTGQTGAAVGTQGAAVGTQGTTVVVGPNGAIAGQGTTVIVTTNFKGNCQSDQCLNTYAPDYYSCLLQNGCGLSSSPLFINGTCASKCAYLYSRIQCCQAGFQPIVSSNTGNSNSNSNSGSNGLQRSIALPPQVQCVQFSQPPQAVSSAGALESGVVVLAALMAGLVF